MKLFYFGSVCSQKKFNETVEKSRVKPSASAQNFEYALIKGFDEVQDLQLTAVSAESIAMFPRGNRLFLKKRRDYLTENISTKIVGCINLPFLKQIGHAVGVYRELVSWLNINKDDSSKAVLVYGIYPAVVKKIMRVCNKYSCKIFCLITDIPKTMFTYTKMDFLKKIFGKWYRNCAVKLQGGFDGYVYLTESMSSEIAPNKPHIVVETIADTTIFDSIQSQQKSDPPAIMYAGALYEKYGVDNIIKVFEHLKTESELWLFGSGDYEEIIAQKQIENPRIKFFGRVDRETVLQKQQEATLLLNIRNPSDEYTKYSFPSKMIEYMLSGTPLVSTELMGIPDEYRDYVYFLNNCEDVEMMAKEIDTILALPNDVHKKLGKSAREFVIEKKNNKVQTKKIIDFIRAEIV